MSVLCSISTMKWKKWWIKPKHLLSFLEEEKWRLKMKLHGIYSNYFQWKHLLNNLFIFNFLHSLVLFQWWLKWAFKGFIQKASSFNAMVNNNKNPNLTNGKYNNN